MGNATSMFLNVILGSVGLGFFVYGTRQKTVIPFLSGIGLMGLPYLISNSVLLILGGLVLIALPFIIRI